MSGKLVQVLLSFSWIETRIGVTQLTTQPSNATHKPIQGSLDKPTNYASLLVEASFQPEAISHLEAQTLGSIHAPVQNLKLTYDKANTYKFCH